MSPAERADQVVKWFQTEGHPYYDELAEVVQGAIEAAVADARAELLADPALVERLADLEHERWSGWMRYLFTKGYGRDDGAFVIDPESVHWWNHLTETPYAELTERSKESDRAEVRKTLAVLRGWPDG